jgi:hypothetical protein
MSMANGGAQSVVSGQRPNWALIAADSFGSSLGNALVNRWSQPRDFSLAEQQQGELVAVDSDTKMSDLDHADPKRILSDANAVAALLKGKTALGQAINGEGVREDYLSALMSQGSYLKNNGKDDPQMVAAIQQALKLFNVSQLDSDGLRELGVDPGRFSDKRSGYAGSLYYDGT